MNRLSQLPILATLAALMVLPACDGNGESGRSMSCGASQLTFEPSSKGAPAVDVDLDGDDRTRTYASGSTFRIHFKSQLPRPDSLTWQIKDFIGAPIASGTLIVGAGTTEGIVQCKSSLSGYFTVSVLLQKSTLTLAQKGSRPAGLASFGVLPDFSRILPSIQPGSLDRNRFGLMGTNYVQSGRCCDGNGLQPVNHDLGSAWVIDQRSWALTEPDHAGQYDPATYPLDVGLKQGTLARIVALNGIPAWASAAPSPTSKGSYPPTSYDEFQAYAARVGQESQLIHARYIPNQSRNYYQITWEPDPGPSTQWMGTDADFVALYQAAWTGLHSTDPNAVVMGPTTSGIALCDAWLNRLSALGLSKYIDAVAVHGYYAIGASSSNPPESAGLPNQMQALRHTITNLLPAGTELFVTETGISYPVGTKYTPTYPTANVLKQHAEAVVRTHLMLLGEGADVSFLFYSADYVEEVGFGLYFNLNMQKEDFGAASISPKPAAMAAATMTRLLGTTRSLGAITQMPPGSYGYSFALADNAHAISALWAHDGSFNASVPFELQGDAAGSTGSAVVIDGMGNSTSKRYSDGKLQLILTEMPIYVLSSNIPALKPLLRAPEGYTAYK